MRISTRIVILLLFFSLCTGGAVLSLNQDASTNQPKTKIFPGNEAKSHRHIWA